MSFDIFFMPCRFGKAAAESTGPNIGKSKRKLPNEPLLPSELDAIRDVLARVNAASAEDGCGIARFPDGGYAEVYGKDLQLGCMVALRGAMSPDLLQFLLDLLRAGNWVMVPAMQDTRAIAASSSAFQKVPEKFPELVVCESREEIRLLLSEGFETWKAYRDQVVDGGSGR